MSATDSAADPLASNALTWERGFTLSPSEPRLRESIARVFRQFAITFADHILNDTKHWGVNDTDQCMAMATALLAMRWLVREGRVSEFGRRP